MKDIGYLDGAVIFSFMGFLGVFWTRRFISAMLRLPKPFSRMYGLGDDPWRSEIIICSKIGGFAAFAVAAVSFVMFVIANA